MSGPRNSRGGALLEFAMVLPFALTLFVGIGDFTVFFWQQIQMEEAARMIIASLPGDLARFAAADRESLQKFTETLQAEFRKTSGRSHVSISITKGHACPLSSGAEREWTEQPQHCPGERTYLKVANDDPVEPLFRPLQHMGYPKTAFSRHTIRIR